MDKDTQIFYDNRFAILSTKGWADLLEDLEQLKDNLENLVHITTEQDLWYKKGQVDMINYLIQLKTLSEQAYEELISEDTE